MIETPRAALRAGEIAEEADFFSFGTNDLTQMTFGFSRDDVEGRMMSAYLEKGLLKHNPFEVVDPDGVGELVRLGVERGRATRPSLKIGVCGEHGGDPESIAVFAEAGLDYVSCSPFRVPIARLAAAQVVLAGPLRPTGGEDQGRQDAPSARPRRPVKASDQGAREGEAEGQGRPEGTAGPLSGTRPGDAVPSTRGHSRRGRRPGPGRHRHRRPDRRARRAEATGTRWVGLCPFHDEKTPSFSVNAEEGFYYCFGCQAKGDAITFVREIEHVDFVEAVRRLADKSGITIPEDASIRSGQPAPQGVPRRHGEGRRVVPRAAAVRVRRRAGAGLPALPRATTARWSGSSAWDGRPTTGTPCAGGWA